MRKRNIPWIYRLIVSDKKYRIKVKLSTYKRIKAKISYIWKQNLEIDVSSIKITTFFLRYRNMVHVSTDIQSTIVNHLMIQNLKSMLQALY